MNFLEFRFIDIYLLITLFGMSLVFFSISILPKNRKDENFLLSIILLLFIAHLTIITLHSKGMISGLAIHRLSFILNLTYGPAFLAYFKKSIKKETYEWQYYGLWLTAGILLPFTSISFGIYDKLIVISLVGHLILVADLIFGKSQEQSVNNWHKFVFGFFALLSSTYFYEILLISQHTINTPWQMRFFYFSELMLLVAGFFFFSLRYPNQFLAVKGVRTNTRAQMTTDPTADMEISLLISSLKQEALYRQPDMQRATLTDLTGISVNRVSELINGRFGVNFSDWVNSYRIEEAKTMLSNEEFGGSIKEICFDVGFNSKSAFNKAFKKHTGMTPTEFKETHSIPSSVI